jgi:MerR family transcriptional regulator, light-induced transcriptional regulator
MSSEQKRAFLPRQRLNLYPARGVVRMAVFSHSPTYNLKAVLKETGIKADVLRAWERRYGMPLPQRTAGGHRLYSELDIQTIKWLIARQAEGLSISRAVELWREYQAEARDPFAEIRQSSTPTPPAVPVINANLAALRADWLTACLNFNEPVAEQVLNQAFGMYPVETVCVDLLQRGMAEVGGLWYENRASVQQEHFASALAMRRLDALMAASPTPTRPQTVLVGCPPDEWHAFTALLMALLLRRRGLNVVYLGANVPADRFAETVTAVHGRMVVLAAQQLITAASLQQSALLLAAHGIPVAFGGRIFSLQPDMVNRIPGHYLGNRLDIAIENVESMLAERPTPPPAISPSAEYLQTLKLFGAKRPLVEASVDAGARAVNKDPDYLATAHKFMGDNILAALQLGDMRYLDSEIDWLNVLLKSQNLPVSVVYDYLRLYAGAVLLHLDGHAPPVVDWLERQISQE